MTYAVSLTNQAEGFLSKLNKPKQIEIRNKIRQLKENPRLGKPLTGRLNGLRSLRISEYRAVYTIKDIELFILILKIGHRKNIYL